MSKICIAMDFPFSRLYDIMGLVRGKFEWCKIGHVMLSASFANSYDIITSAKQHGFKIFLDLKLVELPSVIRKAAYDYAKIADMITIMSQATTEESLIQAVAGAKESNPNVKIIATTGFTWTHYTDINLYVYAKEAWKAGCDGFVCSVKDLKLLRKEFPEAFIVTPGISIHGYPRIDQIRVGTPAQALEAGSDLLVIGRDIYESQDIEKIIENLLKMENKHGKCHGSPRSI